MLDSDMGLGSIVKPGDKIQDKRHPEVILVVEEVLGYGRVGTRSVLNGSPYVLSKTVISERFQRYAGSTLEPKQLMSAKEIETYIESAVDAEFDERTQELKEAEKEKLTSVLKVGDNVRNDFGNRTEVLYIDHVTKHVNSKDLVTNREYVTDFSIVNAKFVRIAPLPKPTPKMKVQVIREIHIHTNYPDFREHTLRDRMYKAYCLRRGRVQEEHHSTLDTEEYHLQTTPEEIATWLSQHLAKQDINKLILKLHKL